MIRNTMVRTVFFVILILFIIVVTGCDNQLIHKVEDDLLGVDNSTPGIVVNPVTGLFTSEDLTTTTFEVVLTSSPIEQVSVPVASLNTAEGTTNVSSLKFTASDWNTPHIVTVTGVDDFIIDGPQPYVIEVGVILSNDPDYDGIDPQDVSVTNTDNDRASIVISPTSGLFVSETGIKDIFSIVLTTIPSESVTVPISSADPEEGSVFPSEIIFNHTNWNIPQDVTVTGVNDDESDGNQTFMILVQAANSNDGDYSGYNPEDVEVTNIDDDTPGITVFPTSGLFTGEDGSTDTFEIVLNSRPTSDVSIVVSSNKPDEGSVSSSQITFTSENWSSAKTITVSGQDDFVDDGDVNYTIELHPSTSSDSDYIGVDPDDIIVTNIDNDTAGFVLSGTSDLSVNESGTTDTFSVKLSSEPLANVSLSVTSSDITEGTANVSVLTFNYENWDTPQDIVIMGVDDDEFDNSEAFDISLGQASSIDSKYSGMNPPDPSVINTGENRIVATPTVTPSSATYYSDQTCVMSCSTPQAKIYYTVSTTSSAPADPTSASALYTGSFSLARRFNNIKAQAYYQDWTSSAVNSKNIYIPYYRTVVKENIVADPSAGFALSSGADYFYIYDKGVHKVLKFSLTGNLISGEDIDNIYGLDDIYLYGNDLFLSTNSLVKKYYTANSPPILGVTYSQNMSYPSGVAYIHSSNKVYVSDNGNGFTGVRIYDGTSGNQTATFTTSDFYTDLDYLNGRIYMSRDNTISVYNLNGSFYKSWSVPGDSRAMPCHIASYIANYGTLDEPRMAYALYAVRGQTVSSTEFPYYIYTHTTVFKYNWDGTLQDQFDVQEPIYGIASAYFKSFSPYLPNHIYIYLLTGGGDLLRYEPNS